MNKTEKQLFNKLSADRKESAKMLEKASMRGLKKSVVEKYSDQAHFIYELIQNADDVGATEAKFILFKDKLVFVHNGTRLFSVTDIDNEDKDSEDGSLGDLNAITSIANSNKTSASIGKFGVGFKAVFQYTASPCIYDPKVAFRIENFIVPVLISNDCKYKTENETAFVFPFDHAERNAAEAYEDISNKLERLVFPTLFLKNLRLISYKFGKTSGFYEMKVIEEKYFEKDTLAQKIEFLSGKSGSNKDVLWLFTRETEEKYKYSCGFFLDEDNKLIRTNYYAFCFFPTKKATNLSFIINAPFLLTDSREGIKAKNKHNRRMMELLSDLSADCFLYLRDIGNENNVMIIDDDILNYIPINEEVYIPNDDGDDISFQPFFAKIKKAFEEEALLPSFKDYVYSGDAYMAFASVISDLFSNKQLAMIVEDDDAEWILPTIGWETLYRARDGKANYIRDIISDDTSNEAGIIRDTVIIESITEEFILSQSKKWLLKLYKFILDTPARIECAKTVPIFISSTGDAVAAYDEEGNATLFLDDEDRSDEYATIDDSYMEYEVVKELAGRMDIKAPELKDKINNVILKKDELNPKTDFRTFLSYYIELVEAGENPNEFIEKISDRKFVLGQSEDGTEKAAYYGYELYFPNWELENYFSGYSDVSFVCIEEYQSYLGKRKEMYLHDFLEALGVSDHVVIYEYDYESKYVYENIGSKWDYSSRGVHWLDNRLEGDEWAIQKIIDNHDKTLSHILWNQLLFAFEERQDTWKSRVIGGKYEYFYFSEKISFFEGVGERLLKTKEWIVDKDGEFRSASELSVQSLNREYNISNEAGKRLLAFLDINDEHPEYDSLPVELRKKIETVDALEKAGYFSLSEEEQQKLIKQSQLTSAGSLKNVTEDGIDVQTPVDRILYDIKKELSNRADVDEEDSNRGPKEDESKLIDNDEITKASVDYSKQIEKAKKQCEDEISRLTQIEEARNEAAEANRYSYKWFSSLLQLEAMTDGDENAKSREVSITFSKVELEPGTMRTLILRHPNKNIPAVMEELVDIPLDLSLDDGTSKRLVIEVANVKSYTLRVKVKQNDFLHNADYSKITQANIVAQSPTFLTKELQKQFKAFSEKPCEFREDYDMQANLKENIEFIFGPPGTGKTTFLATEKLIPLINSNKKVKILVLAPTNKAADVLTMRIMDSVTDEERYKKWLIRYGVTGEESIERSPVFHGKEMNINEFKKCAVITTMIRLPYDYFIESDNSRRYLRDINWDYVIVDEASMIPLVQMVYMIYKLVSPKNFIIAGDPFQIEPTTAVSEWKNENIYTMTHLEKFSDEVQTVPHEYDITLLTKQYRSVESIGEIFSQLTYGGVLKHARKNEDTRLLNIEKYLDYENLNIIRFPVSDYESIYRPKRLKQSSYQVYSALFVYEFSTYLAKALATENDDVFNIGIIAPYSAQAGLIDKLLVSAEIPKSIHVSSGTIHGFQGDECDIIIAVFNPPPHISTNEEMFLNRKNIVNVAISRARDYLFILVPDDDTKNVQNLFLINKLKRLVEKDLHTDQDAKALEGILFDNEDYLEENAFTTGHQLVNVYGHPEKHYEIRSEDNALDVQVYGHSTYRILDEDEEGDDYGQD